MKTKYYAMLLVPILGCLISGCSNLESPHVIGEPVEFDDDLVGEVISLNLGGRALSLRLGDEHRFAVAWVEWDETSESFSVDHDFFGGGDIQGIRVSSESFEIGEAELIVSELGSDVMFANLRSADEKNYSIFRLSMVCHGIDDEATHWIAYSVDDDVMDRLAADEANRMDVSGQYGSTFVLRGSKEEIDAFMKAHYKEAFLYTAGFYVEQLNGEVLFD